MKFFKYFALLTLAVVPLLLAEKKKEAPVDQDDNIFDHELTTD